MQAGQRSGRVRSSWPLCKRCALVGPAETKHMPLRLQECGEGRLTGTLTSGCQRRTGLLYEPAFVLLHS